MSGSDLIRLDDHEPSISQKRESILKDIRNARILAIVFWLSGLIILCVAYFKADEVPFGVPSHGGGSILIFPILLMPYIWHVLAMACALAMMAVGTVFYARMKGRSGYWGLLGIFCVPGAIAVLFLEKKCRVCSKGGECLAGHCEHCGAPM